MQGNDQNQRSTAMSLEAQANSDTDNVSHLNAAHRRAGRGTPQENDYKASFRDAPYYSTGRDWHDYAPAYRYGLAAHAAHGGQPFDAVESQLAEGWNSLKTDSRLGWAEARGAVRDVWQQLDAVSGGPDRRQVGR